MLVFGDAEDTGDILSKVEEGLATGAETTPTTEPRPEPEPTSLQYCLKLMMCIVGLQVAYLTWGVLQVQKKKIKFAIRY